MRQGLVEALPIKNLSLPKREKRLPGFLTRQQMLDLLAAPMQTLAAGSQKKGVGRPLSPEVALRDVAVLETIYSCGLRVSEVCGLRVEDIDWNEQIVRVRGKGRKERLVPIGEPALKAVQTYWGSILEPPMGAQPVFRADTKRALPLNRLQLARRLKIYLGASGFGPQINPPTS